LSYRLGCESSVSEERDQEGKTFLSKSTRFFKLSLLDAQPDSCGTLFAIRLSAGQHIFVCRLQSIRPIQQSGTKVGRIQSMEFLIREFIEMRSPRHLLLFVE